MKEYLNHLWKEKLIIILVLFSSFLLGFTLTSVIKTYTSEYQFSFDVFSQYVCRHSKPVKKCW